MSEENLHRHRAILTLLSAGRSPADVVLVDPSLTLDDVSRAAAAGLAALEAGPRVETRADRIARLRETHARAYAPWTQEEDAQLLDLWAEARPVAEIGRELGRQPNSIRARLEKHLGSDWRVRPEAVSEQA